ncbi:hypothetical protein TREMEDRAFT_59504 [Tremella mesenterica DSM 1558]|uniref:uncharacterized protein n=1 Tax=Tremella mesenterica (strain ATCC 24925 / CBS 8224 / DSM 1558 / NBRC 9311 / NRRL Y-6157 / RJB 2259-6 / UBC 559-6) TaxID=578456 RepID=UPI0003F49CCE|nr:uncharacterized protein TREMEDRAFT_59504 [Tremella mesenterica DSM 1558]EIW73337.1 hypothetical protein TREMEDRAFT_59504 [Tremella mesenterica DSM 1558]
MAAWSSLRFPDLLTINNELIEPEFQWGYSNINSRVILHLSDHIRMCFDSRSDDFRSFIVPSVLDETGTKVRPGPSLLPWNHKSAAKIMWQLWDIPQSQSNHMILRFFKETIVDRQARLEFLEGRIHSLYGYLVDEISWDNAGTAFDLNTAEWFYITQQGLVARLVGTLFLFEKAASPKNGNAPEPGPYAIIAQRKAAGEMDTFEVMLEKLRIRNHKATQLADLGACSASLWEGVMGLAEMSPWCPLEWVFRPKDVRESGYTAVYFEILQGIAQQSEHLNLLWSSIQASLCGAKNPMVNRAQAQVFLKGLADLYHRGSQKPDITAEVLASYQANFRSSSLAHARLSLSDPCGPAESSCCGSFTPEDFMRKTGGGQRVRQQELVEALNTASKQVIESTLILAKRSRDYLESIDTTDTTFDYGSLSTLPYQDVTYPVNNSLESTAMDTVDSLDSLYHSTQSDPGHVGLGIAMTPGKTPKLADNLEDIDENYAARRTVPQALDEEEMKELLSNLEREQAEGVSVALLDLHSWTDLGLSAKGVAEAGLENVELLPTLSSHSSPESPSLAIESRALTHPDTRGAFNMKDCLELVTIPGCRCSACEIGEPIHAVWRADGPGKALGEIEGAPTSEQLSQLWKEYHDLSLKATSKKDKSTKETSGNLCLEEVPHPKQKELQVSISSHGIEDTSYAQTAGSARGAIELKDELEVVDKDMDRQVSTETVLEEYEARKIEVDFLHKSREAVRVQRELVVGNEDVDKQPATEKRSEEHDTQKIEVDFLRKSKEALIETLGREQMVLEAVYNHLSKSMFERETVREEFSRRLGQTPNGATISMEEVQAKLIRALHVHAPILNELRGRISHSLDVQRSKSEQVGERISQALVSEADSLRELGQRLLEALLS